MPTISDKCKKTETTISKAKQKRDLLVKAGFMHRERIKKKIDPRINAGSAFVKESLLLFCVIATLFGLHNLIYEELVSRGVMETNTVFGISMLLLFVIVAAVLTTISIGIIRHITWNKPVRLLSEAAREIAKGDFSVNVQSLRKDGKKDIVEVLFDDFNTMTSELEASQNLLKDYADNLEKKVDEKTNSVLNLQNAVLASLANLVEFRDPFTGGHISRTQLFLGILVNGLIQKGIYAEELATKDMKFFLPSAQLHDVGKIAISDMILNKPAKLTPEEFEIMKTHTTAGEGVIEGIMKITDEHTFLKYALFFSGTHHEKWDGSGYPQGLSGTDIPLEGRLMAIADVYDALISRRPYKDPFSHEEAKKIIEEGSGSYFDPALVNIFCNVADEFANVAERVKLDDLF